MLVLVDLQIVEKALVEEIHWASMVLAASLESSEDQRPVVRIQSTLGMGEGLVRK